MKFKELKTKSEEEIKRMLKELKEQAQDLSVKKRMDQLKDTHQLKVVKKDIARILTYINNK